LGMKEQVPIVKPFMMSYELRLSEGNAPCHREFQLGAFWRCGESRTTRRVIRGANPMTNSSRTDCKASTNGRSTLGVEAAMIATESRGGIDAKTLVEGLFSLLRARPRERAAALPIAEARMDERTRRITLRHMLRKHIAAILRARDPALHVDAARDMAVVVLQLMKAASSLSDEQGLPGRVAGLRELQSLAAHYLEWRRPA
jgi:hypothetical protein